MLKPLAMLFVHDGMAGHAQFTAQIEQVMLHAGKAGANFGWQVLAQQQTDGAVGLVHGAQRFDARLVLGDA